MKHFTKKLCKVSVVIGDIEIINWIGYISDIKEKVEVIETTEPDDNVRNYIPGYWKKLKLKLYQKKIME